MHFNKSNRDSIKDLIRKRSDRNPHLRGVLDNLKKAIAYEKSVSDRDKLAEIGLVVNTMMIR